MPSKQKPINVPKSTPRNTQALAAKLRKAGPMGKKTEKLAQIHKEITNALITAVEPFLDDNATDEDLSVLEKSKKK